MNKDDIDLNAILIKPVYIGLLMNAVVPLALLAIAYFTDPDSARSSPNIPAEHAALFWALFAVSVVDGIVAIFLRQKLFSRPLISSKETFEEDLKQATFSNSIICFALTTAIMIFGFVFFLVSGAFKSFLFFTILMVVIFQMIRPRHGFIRKVIDRQWAMVEQGRFAEVRK